MKTTDSKYSKCLYFAANALARKIEKLAIEIWKPLDLSPSHAYLLMMVIEQPGLQPGCIANHLQLTPSTITRLIEKLEEKQLVERITEGKTTAVFASTQGAALEPLLKQCIDTFFEKSCCKLGKEESERMVEDMCLLADKLDE
jgi:DNA-binding MarR family transcriptional regulator